MYRTLFDPHEIPADIREYFEETSAACGKPWARATERVNGTRYGDGGEAAAARLSGGLAVGQATRMGDPIATTTGWSPSCRCGTTETRPCVVLDPFAGAGTTLLVADRLQRDAIGIELSPDYTTMAMERCRADAPLFTSFPPAEDPEETRMGDLFAEAAE